jgi:uncharacterized damage-inducible protein DinB
MFGMVIVALITSSMRPDAQSTGLQAELLKDLTTNRDLMIAIANAMPDDKFAFRATPAQRTYGEQIMHVAVANVTLFKLLASKAQPPTIDPKASTKAAIVKALTDSYDFAVAATKEQTDQTVLQAVVAPPAPVGPSSRARVVTFSIGHAMDIYGQMAVYLRLNGIVPPASRSSM